MKNPVNPDPARLLPDRANLEHLKKEAKQRLKAMRLDNPVVTLSEVQLAVAREYGFSSWRRLIAHVKSQPDKESQLPDQQRKARPRPSWLQAIHDGLEAVEKGDYQTAVAHFYRAETEYPALNLSTVQLAVTKYYGERRWSDLYAYIKSLPDKGQLRPTDADLSNAFNDGLEAADKGYYQTAVAHFRLALRERPLRIQAHYYLGRSLFHMQLFREALAAFEELLKLDPENLPAHYEIAKLHLYARNYPPALLRKFDPEHLLANYEIGARYLSSQNYADAIAKYQWLKSQSEGSTGGFDDSDYELFPDRPRSGTLAHNPFHRAYAAKLAYYLLDLIPPKIAEQFQLPSPRIAFDDDVPIDQQAALINDQPETLEPMTILYKHLVEYTEIARINRLKGPLVLSALFIDDSRLAGIKVVRGLPDGLTRRAIHAMQSLRFTAASLNGTPVSRREIVEFDLNPG